MKIVYVILVFISLVSADLKTLENSVVNINEVIDRAIPHISKRIVDNDLDPLNLPPLEKKISVDITNSTVEDQIQRQIYKTALILHSGLLKHLSNLKRYGNATLNYENKIVKLDFGFEFTFLQATYNFTVDLVPLILNGRILASATNVHTKIIITFNTMNYTLSLDKFELEVPSMKMIIENKNGLVDWINTVILRIITPFFKDGLTNIIQEEATTAIRTYIDEINRIISKSQLLSI